MHIDYKTHTIELTNDIREYVASKIGGLIKLVPHTAEQDIRVEVELARKSAQQTGDVYRTDITIHAGSERMHAVGHGESLNASIDESKDELSRRLRREKGKKHDLFIQGATKIKKMLRFWE